MYTKIKIKIKHIIPLVVLTLFVAIVSAQITPDPMPLNIRATNVFDTKFTISWTTNGTFTGAIKYGTDPKKLNNQVFDDRGDVEDDIHHVTVSGLNPNTTYYYSIVSGRKTFRTYNITTGPTLGIPRVPDTKYGRVFLSDGITPSNSSIVYISIGKSATISELVQNGYWMANFGDLRTADNSAYYNYKDYDRVNIFAQGASDGSGTITPKVKDCYSAPNIILSTAPIKVTHNFGVETRANLNRIKLINNPPSIKVIYPNGRENLSKR
ncbi:MAG: fibronectin type III domain-containing protein, partial [Methanosarcinales archaeon]